MTHGWIEVAHAMPFLFKTAIPSHISQNIKACMHSVFAGLGTRHTYVTGKSFVGNMSVSRVWKGAIQILRNQDFDPFLPYPTSLQSNLIDKTNKLYVIAWM